MKDKRYGAGILTKVDGTVLDGKWIDDKLVDSSGNWMKLLGLWLGLKNYNKRLIKRRDLNYLKEFYLFLD